MEFPAIDLHLQTTTASFASCALTSRPGMVPIVARSLHCKCLSPPPHLPALNPFRGREQTAKNQQQNLGSKATELSTMNTATPLLKGKKKAI